MGFKLVATAGTADVLEDAGLSVERVYKVKEGRPNVVDLIKGERIQLIINTPHGADPWFDEKAIRRAAVTARITTITTLSAARAAAEGIAALQRGEVRVQALQSSSRRAGGGKAAVSGKIRAGSIVLFIVSLPVLIGIFVYGPFVRICLSTGARHRAS